MKQWEVGKANAYEDAPLVVRQLDGTIIAHVVFQGVRSEYEATARLLAAAPELLEVARRFVDVFAGTDRADSSLYRDMVAAVTKADA